MGEVAEMMVNGLLCQCCGVLMDDHEEPGYARTCNGCLRDMERPQHVSQVPKVACPTCGKKVKPLGLRDHQRDVHGQGSAEVERMDRAHEDAMISEPPSEEHGQK